MKIAFNMILALLVFLAVSSGVTKIMLMPQDVEFFGEYGFTNPILMGFGLIQLVGGILLIIPRTRFWGALMVTITFLISAIILIISGNLALTLVTLFVLSLLLIVMKQSFKRSAMTPQ
ncbi:MAG: DoxX family protein [Arenicella sp.]